VIEVIFIHEYAGRKVVIGWTCPCSNSLVVCVMGLLLSSTVVVNCIFVVN